MADLSVSLFAADIFHLEHDLQMVNGLPLFSLHVDIMDGHFVPLCGFNQMWIRKIQELRAIPMDFHFMAYLDKEMLKQYLELQPIRVILHIEANKKDTNMELLDYIRKKGISTGIALSPETDILEIHDYLHSVDDILLMSSQPGRENAIFNEKIYERIHCLKNILQGMNDKITISVDGGINEETANICIENGANRIIMGRAFFNSKEKAQTVNHIIESL